MIGHKTVKNYKFGDDVPLVSQSHMVRITELLFSHQVTRPSYRQSLIDVSIV